MYALKEILNNCKVLKIKSRHHVDNSFIQYIPSYSNSAFCDLRYLSFALRPLHNHKIYLISLDHPNLYNSLNTFKKKYEFQRIQKKIQLGNAT